MKKNSKPTTLTVTGGFFRSRVIRIPSGLCHPMGDRQRQALFNRLQSGDYLMHSYVLDLFAGSGMLGIEALSRGASMAYFVESNRRLCDRLSTNLVSLRIEEFTNIIAESALKFCQKYHLDIQKHQAPKFDVIFADPPYDDIQLDFLEEIPNILALNGAFMLSLPADHNAPEVNGLELVAEKTHAGCHLCFYGKP